METDGTKGTTTGAGDLTRPPKKSSSKIKWIVIAVVVIVVISAVAVVLVTSSAKPSESPSIVSAPISGTVGSPYNLIVNTNGNFKYADVYFGDGTMQNVSGTGSTLNVSHTYQSAGSYYIYYTITYSDGKVVNNLKTLVRAYISNSALAQNESSGIINVVPSGSSAQISNNASGIFNPGSHVSLALAYATPPANSTYSVYGQNLEVFNYTTLTATQSLGYTFNLTAGGYLANYSDSYYNVSSLKSGFYVLQLNTLTAIVNGTTGKLSGNKYNVSVVMDMPVFNSTQVGIYHAASGSSFTNAELETGGYKTFDPQIAYDTVSFEPLVNTMQYLVGYQGSSNSSFYPELASALPTSGHGINSANVTRTIAEYNGTTNSWQNVSVTYAPGQVYTFTIRSNATWQDGTSVTSWDAAFSIIRDLLFDGGSPGTPGWIIGQVLLPGDLYTSNTYQNITNNVTWSNSSNTVTLYLQSPQAPTLMFELLSASGDFIINANWAYQHGAGLTFSPAGFTSYKAEANAGSYDTYIQNNIMADGPYMIDYTVTDSQVVMEANPNYNPPATYNGVQWDPRPSIQFVNIEYIGQPSTTYLDLKSGAAQAGGIPTSNWYNAKTLASSHIVNLYPFPTLSIFWYNYNARVNMSGIGSYDKHANLPSSLFSNLQVRLAFAYAYNYAFYLNQQVGNAVYNTTFAYSYAGMLPAGMAYSQSISQLNKVTTGVPYFDLAKAKMYWNEFLNSSVNKNTYKITSTGTYNGSALNIPIFIFSADPVDLEGATTWAQNISKIVGSSTSASDFPVLPTSFTTLLGNMVGGGGNPMPIYELGWAPDYPFPTDYLAPMALPVSGTTYPGPNSMTTSWIGNASNPAYNATELGVLNSMVDEYTNGTSTLNATQQAYYFHQMNQNLVNMTFYVYIEQASAFWIISSKIAPSGITQFEMNVMIGGGADLLYNDLTYS